MILSDRGPGVELSHLPFLATGMSPEVVWSWYKSPQLFAPKGLPPFEESKCRSYVEYLEASRCVEVLHSLGSLELQSRLTAHLTAEICSFLAPQLHDLRAKDVLVVARALSPERLPDTFWSQQAPAARWREQGLELCFESLRRHEHFLEPWTF